ncbi:MAG: copper-binding protein [Candidatus Binatia bacterium]
MGDLRQEFNVLMKVMQVVASLTCVAWVMVLGVGPSQTAEVHKHKMPMKPEMKMDMATEEVFEGVGKVVLADTRKGQIVVDHEEIPGFMAAMIMGYPVKTSALLQELEPGDRIRFTIDAEKKVIVDIRRAQTNPMPTMQGEKTHNHTKHHGKMPPRSTLKPAEGASVRILSPKQGAAFHSDQVSLRYTLIKGKRGNHVHAYLDGQLSGMFKPDEGAVTGEGILTGISPGPHTLEVRIVTKDHNTELDATDTVHFMVK